MADRFTLGFVLGVATSFVVCRLHLFNKKEPQQQQQRAPNKIATVLRHKKAENLLNQIVADSFTASLLNVGVKLGIYDLLWKHGPISAHELALKKKRNWSGRWVLEFLCQMTACGICEYDAQTEQFRLPREFAILLCSQDCDLSKLSMAGTFPLVAALVQRSETVLEQGIRTGVGVDYDWPAWAEGHLQLALDQRNRPWFEAHLIRDVIERIRLPSTGRPLVELLERGVDVADAGCGCGASTFVLARRFPKSMFYAFESSNRALDIMTERIRREKVQNIKVCNVSTWSIGDGPRPGDKSPDNMFSLIYTHDMLHDLANPLEFIQEVHSRLAPGGCWVIVDVNAHQDLRSNLQRTHAAELYGFSCLLCLPSATTVPNEQALGTLGLSTSLCREWTKSAGFSQFVTQKIESAPLSTMYVVE